MAFVTCDMPASYFAELTRRASANGGRVSSLVSEALAGYLDAPLHTLFQVSTSGSLVEGVYALALLWHLYDHGAVLYQAGIQRSVCCVPIGRVWR